MEGSVYMILNTKNSKMYIGSTVNYDKRKRAHINGLKGKYHDNRKLQEEFDLYGEKYFVFNKLCDTSNTEERYNIEESIIQSLKTYENGYNLSYDGRGRYLITDEVREKFRQRSIGENNPFFGKEHTEEVRKLLSEKARGRYVGENNPFYGRTHSQETLDRIANSFEETKASGWVNPQKGVPKTKEAIYNNMMAQPTRKPVVAEGLEYPSISAAAKDIGVVNATIRKRLENPSFEDYYYLSDK